MFTFVNDKIKNMERIYHPYWLWEDFKNGFYDNISGKEKLIHIEKVLEMFNSYSLTDIYMERVISEWKYSCEHNLTNESLNKIAYIGQGACNLYYKTPSTITMECWSLLSDEVKERSNGIALQKLNKWLDKNKRIQLCLNLD